MSKSHQASRTSTSTASGSCGKGMCSATAIFGEKQTTSPNLYRRSSARTLPQDPNARVPKINGSPEEFQWVRDAPFPSLSLHWETGRSLRIASLPFRGRKPPPHVRRGMAKFLKGLYRNGDPVSKFSTQKTLRLEREKRLQPRMGQKVSIGLKDMGMGSKVVRHGEWELC